MTFGVRRTNGGFLNQGGMASKVIRDKVCRAPLGTSVPAVRTPNWSRPMGLYLAKLCLSV